MTVPLSLPKFVIVGVSRAKYLSSLIITLKTIAMDSVDYKTSSSDATGPYDIPEENELPQMSLILSADEEDDPMETSATTAKQKRKRLIIADDSDDEVDKHPADLDQEDYVPAQEKSTRRNQIIDDSDDDEGSGNVSKSVVRNLKSICDEESSDEEQEERRPNSDSSSSEGSGVSDEEGPRRRRSVKSDNEESRDEKATSPIRKKEKNPSRKAKIEAENVISMIQRNAREEELSYV